LRNALETDRERKRKKEVGPLRQLSRATSKLVQEVRHSN
jgi:hypothetical protein